ncbi:Uncharacterised protein [Mycobacteroides abscessus subsp. abscessus]|nr:Uncharacterised protein [Mycobacteroides abscessus subsp. abscessus]
MPCGVVVRPVPAARTEEVHGGTGSNRRGPGSGDALVTVHDEVDRDLARVLIDGADGVGAQHRLLFGR